MLRSHAKLLRSFFCAKVWCRMRNGAGDMSWINKKNVQKTAIRIFRFIFRWVEWQGWRTKRRVKSTWWIKSDKIFITQTSSELLSHFRRTHNKFAHSHNEFMHISDSLYSPLDSRLSVVCPLTIYAEAFVEVFFLINFQVEKSSSRSGNFSPFSSFIIRHRSRRWNERNL